MGLLLFLPGCSFSCDFGDEDVVSNDTGTGVHEGSSDEHEGYIQGAERYEGNGFAVSIPDGWIYEEPEDYMVIFSGQEGTEAYDATMNIQTLQWGLAYNSFEDFYEDYKSQLKTVEGADSTVSDLGFESFTQNGMTFETAGFTADYTMNGVAHNQLIIALDRGDQFFYQISYTAPQDLFQKYENEATYILDTLEVLEVNHDETNVERTDAGAHLEEIPYDVELEILNEELIVKHKTEHIYVDLEVKNVGELPIEFSGVTEWTPDYQFIAMLDDEELIFSPDETENKEGDFVYVGYKGGVRIFESIAPGETEVLRYGLGGITKSSKGGTSGLENSVSARFRVEDRDPGKAELKVIFAVTKEEVKDRNPTITGANYEEYMDVVSNSNTIDVKLLSIEADLSKDSLPCPLDGDLIEDLNLNISVN